MTLSLEIAEWLTEWSKSSLGQQMLGPELSGRSADAAARRLRKAGLSLEQVVALAELAELRQRAASKFDCAHELFFTRRAYEQASGQATAQWKHALLRAAWPTQPIVVLDLCCGIGGDLLELARHFPVIGLDRDAALVHLLRENLRILAEKSPLCPHLMVSADVTGVVPLATAPPPTPETPNKDAARQPHLGGRPLREWLPTLPREVDAWARDQDLLEHRVVWHLDPDRRDEAGRHTTLSKLSPDETFLARLREWSNTGIVKLAPATELDERWRALGHWQWLGRDRECKQLLGCFGFGDVLPAGAASVAVSRRGQSEWELWQPAVGGRETPPRCIQPLRYLYEPHPAFFAARLGHALAAAEQWQWLAGGDYYTSNERSEPSGELFSAFQVLEVFPLRVAKIREWLVQQRRHLVEIKSRTVAEKDWKPLAAFLPGAPGRDEQAGLSCLLFNESKPGGKALRVALCERLRKVT